MKHCLAFLLALMFATISVSSACVAGSPDWIGFTLRPEHGDGGRIHASFRDEERDRDRNSWWDSTSPGFVGPAPGLFTSP